MEAIHSEALCRLPGVFMAFQPPQESPEVSELPALDGRPLTFGCFNNFAKVTPNVIALWAQLLEAIPNSRLLLKNGDFANLKHQAKVREQFASHGIPADRLLFSGADAGQHEHLLWYHQVDIGLDPFPYNGATTTCDTLWMGVPVVALAGDRFLGRIGASLLNNSGLSDLVAETPEEYIAIAVRLANDLPGLADLRRRLRAQVAVAPIMDALRFTRTLENAYRAMWQLWCADPDFDFAQRTPLIVPPPDEAALQVPVTQRLPAPEAAETGQDSDSMGSEAVEAIAAVAAIAQGAPAPTLAPPAIKLMIRGMPMTLTQALQRGYEWLRVGELEAAEEVYQAVVEAVPEHADAWNRLGGIYYQRGDFAKAEEYLARAVECFGDHPQFHNNLAIARLMLGKPDQAEASCRRALALKPDYVEALNNMGAALEAQSRFTSAAKHYKRVLEFEPFFAEGHYNLGNALRGAGRVDEAIESYRKALELRPRDAKTLHQLGTVWQALGGYGKEAEECFTLARKLEAETEVA
jgi:predicted O-linked N-acetylglucosamine transferase (SPINDLY family)